MMTQSGECVVHNRKYLSKFHGNINQLRRTNEFHFTILQQLPKRCCSCHEQNREALFDLNHLHELCQQIQLSQKGSLSVSDPVKPIHYLVLEYPPTFSSVQQVYKAGRFVGRGGQHLQLIEQTLNISIKIINRKSNKNFRQMIDQLKQQDKDNSREGLWLLINMKNDEDNIENIKQSLKNEWNKIDVTTKKKRVKKSQSSQKVISLSTSISGDTRWKPKKQKARDKHLKQKQYDEEEEVQPQPLVRPISMPKEITKSKKNKRK